jgi:hypothetical protein
MTSHKNSGGSLDFNGQDNSEKHTRGNTQYDYNQSKLTPKTTGDRCNGVGNMGKLADINGKQPVTGSSPKRPTAAPTTVGRGPTVGNARG